MGHTKLKIDKEVRKGTITFIHNDGGYGFIEEEDGERSIFFHAMGVIHPIFEELRLGMDVEYISATCGIEGKERRAIGVRRIANE